MIARLKNLLGSTYGMQQCLCDTILSDTHENKMVEKDTYQVVSYCHPKYANIGGIHLKYLNITCYGETYYDFLSDIYMLIATGV